MFDEYIMYSLEKRLDEHRRTIGLLSYWPAQHDQSGQVTTQSGYETAMAGFASMDELFRKSGLLAFTQPAGEGGEGGESGVGGVGSVPVTPAVRRVGTEESGGEQQQYPKV